MITDPTSKTCHGHNCSLSGVEVITARTDCIICGKPLAAWDNPLADLIPLRVQR